MLNRLILPMQLFKRRHRIAVNTAGLLGFEPRRKVLETLMLPLHHSPMLFCHYILNVENLQQKIKCLYPCWDIPDYGRLEK